MIKPPFTILILKDSHHPVTIRVTPLLLFVLAVLFSLCIGFGTVGITTRIKDRNPYFSKPQAPPAHAGYILSESVGDSKKNGTSSGPEVKDLTIQQTGDGTIEIVFTFDKVETEKEFFVWLIVNPDAMTAGEKLVYPRGPIFRGLPVDYRNGIIYNAAEKNYLKATFSGPVVGIDFKQFRILAYSPQGTIRVDKLFTIQQKMRM